MEEDKKRKNKKWNSNCFNQNKELIVNGRKEEFFIFNELFLNGKLIKDNEIYINKIKIIEKWK